MLLTVLNLARADRPSEPAPQAVILNGARVHCYPRRSRKDHFFKVSKAGNGESPHESQVPVDQTRSRHVVAVLELPEHVS